MRYCLAVLCSVVVCCSADNAPGKLPEYGVIDKDIIEPNSKYVVFKKPEQQRTLQIVLLATKVNATLHVDGKLAWWCTLANDPYNEERGLHVLLVHPITGQVQGHAVASGWRTVGVSHALRDLLHSARQRDMFIFFTVGGIGPGMGVDEDLYRAMAQIGAKHFSGRAPRDMYALLCFNGGPVVAEAYTVNKERGLNAVDGQSLEPTSPLAVSVSVPVPPVKDVLCPWTETAKNLARAKFCFKYNGYGELCDCEKDKLLPFKHSQLEQNNLTDVPIAIIASNRPQALFKQMSSLLRNRGVIFSNIIVFVDGDHAEVDQLCSLLDIKCVSQTSDSDETGLRIRKHYHQSLTKVWHHFPAASRLIVLEEDLDVSPDFISYFSQTSHLLDLDSTLQCISAWNDNGYEDNSSDPALLYRVEQFPGLGWMMTRAALQELLDKWSSETQGNHWDVWVSWETNKLGRECVVPDVSRTFHFGITGSHTNSYMHAVYFQDHAFNKHPDVQLRNVNSLLKDEYEKEIQRLIAEAEPIKASDLGLFDTPPSQGGPCELELEGTNKTYAFFFRMTAWEDTELFTKVARCFIIWDHNVRGHHHGLWRLRYNDNNVLLFAAPISKYMNDVMRYFKHPVDVVQTLL